MQQQAWHQGCHRCYHSIPIPARGSMINRRSTKGAASASHVTPHYTRWNTRGEGYRMFSHSSSASRNSMPLYAPSPLTFANANMVETIKLTFTPLVML